MEYIINEEEKQIQKTNELIIKLMPNLFFKDNNNIVWSLGKNEKEDKNR